MEVEAAADDNRSIASAEARIGDSPWTAMDATDGAFGEDQEAVQLTITAPSGDEYQVCVRSSDGAGNVSDTVCAVLTVTGAAAVVAGSAHTCAVLSDRTARCWGANESGQLGDGLTLGLALPVAVLTGAGEMLEDVKALAAGSHHTCALMMDGSVRCWGDNAFGQVGDGGSSDRPFARRVSGLSKVTAISAGTNHTCARIERWHREVLGPQPVRAAR